MKRNFIKRVATMALVGVLGATALTTSAASLTAIFYSDAGNVRGVEGRSTGFPGFVTTFTEARDGLSRATHSSRGLKSSTSRSQIVYRSGTLSRSAWSVQ